MQDKCPFVYDQCKSKECIRDLRVYLPSADQALINNNSVSVKPRCAELLHVSIDVEKIQFHRGFYTVDIRFFYRITVEICTGVGRPTIIDGLAIFDKRCILFGSEGGARIFSSKFVEDSSDIQLNPRSNLPRAVVEVVDPILLEAKVVSPSCCCCREITEVPPAICRCFQGEALDMSSNCNLLCVTLGQFSIIKLERDIQLLMPALDVCMPDKDCSQTNGISGENEDPCKLFSTFEFPIDEFFPPKNDCCSCGCGCGSGGTGVGGMTTTDCNCTSVCGTQTGGSCGCGTQAGTCGCGTQAGACGCKDHNCGCADVCGTGCADVGGSNSGNNCGCGCGTRPNKGCCK